MEYIFLNIGAISSATVASFLFGAAYYVALNGPWGRAAGMVPKYRPSIGAYAWVALSEFWMACILAGALILAPPEAGAWTMAIGTAIIIWIGFVGPAILATDRLRARPWILTLIDVGHWLGVMLVQVAVMTLIGVSN